MPPRRTPNNNTNMDMNAALQAMTQMATAVAQQTAAKEQRDILRQQRDAENAASRGLTDFKKHDPPQFQGEVDPEKADYWVQSMEKIFTASGTPIARKVEYATYMLTGDAEYWWKSAQGLMIAAGEELTWESFSRRFLDKYFPQTARTKLGDDFLKLRQGTMSIGEYAAKFESMSRYFRFFQTDIDEDYMCHRFQEGLRYDIQDSVIPLGIKNFQPLVEKCREIEIMKNRRLAQGNKGNTGGGSGGPMKNNDQRHREKSHEMPYHRSQENTRGPHHPKAQDFGAGGSRSKNGELRCYRCGEIGHYANECSVKGNICFKCKKPGHIAKDCKVPKAESTVNAVRAKHTTNQGRVFCMNGGED